MIFSPAAKTSLSHTTPISQRNIRCEIFLARKKDVASATSKVDLFDVGFFSMLFFYLL